MKLLVATGTGHSPRTDPDNDLPLPGELLMPAEQCDKPHCFCRREFVSVTTHERTTHARVAELDITPEQLRAIAVDYVVYLFDDPDTDEVDAYVHDLTGPAEGFEVGTVVERDITDNNLDDDDA